VGAATQFAPAAIENTIGKSELHVDGLNKGDERIAQRYRKRIARQDKGTLSKGRGVFAGPIAARAI
jgi:hypothetical protein